MAGDSRRELLGNSRSSEQPAFLELFLDLVYVFALTRVSQRLTDDFTLQRHTLLSELGQTTLLVLALWALWSLNARMTSSFDPEQLIIQLIVAATMFGSMVMALSLPQAFGDLGVIFASTYVAIQVGRPLTLLLALGRHFRRTPSVRILFWAGLSAVPWIAGALSGGAGRGILWTAAVILDYLGAFLRWPTPWLGWSKVSEWRIASKHLAQRYQQFLLVALGESILATGFVISGLGFGVARTTAFVASFVTTLLLWRIYFYRAGRFLAAAIDRAENPVRFSQSASFTHLVMVGGVIASGVGYGLIIREPHGHLDRAWLLAILGGPALFLAGRARFEYEVLGRVSRSRWFGLVALIVIAPGIAFLPPLAGPIAGTLVVAGIAIADMIRARSTAAVEVDPPL